MTDTHQVPVTIEEEMKRSYLDYAMSVIIGRAIPDVRDGLKPVHRRILYSMHEQSVKWNSSYKKSARIVGDVLGKYHPHGDSAVYDALVRMAQDFSMRNPLVDGQGNFGSVDGDPAAAMRYTEVRMTRLAGDLLEDIEKETVDFTPNFDDSEREPSVLPSRIPNLLVNGSGGIAVGMATNIPPHNLKEIVDGVIRLMQDPSLTVDQLMQDDEAAGRVGIKGPDFPTAGYIYGAAGIVQGYRTGRGRVLMRAKADIEPNANKKDREQIVVTEIPYQVNKAELLKKIADLVRDKKIEGISDLRDESDRDGMRMVIELKKDAHGEVVLNQLYQMTALQSTFGYNCLAIVGGRPKVLNLKDTLVHFIQHRKEVVTRRTRFELRQALNQKELVEGLGMAVTDIDLVVNTIRSSKDPSEAKIKLMELSLHGLEEFVKRAGRTEEEIQTAKESGDYFLTERQAKAILEMRLQKLTGLEREKLAKEYGELCEIIIKLEKILSDELELKRVVTDELEEVRAKYGDDRKTQILEAEGEISIEDLIVDEEVVITATQAGYIKRVPLTEYRAQGRAGKGSKALTTKDEDFVNDLFITNTHAHILFVSDKGQVYLKRVYEIPQGSRQAKGRAIVNFVGMKPDEKVAAIVPVREFVDDGFLLTCTKKGRVKRTELSAYSKVRQTGILGVGIDENDELLTASVVTSDQQIIVGSSSGRSIRFEVSEVRPSGRGSMGVRGIDVRDKDDKDRGEVVGMDVIDDESKSVLTISENGFGKRSSVDQWRVQSRGGVGVISMITSERNGPMVKLKLVSQDDEIMVITDKGKVIRTRVDEIREAGRNTQGVRVIRLSEGEKVVDIAKIAEQDIDDTDNENLDGAQSESAADDN